MPYAAVEYVEVEELEERGADVEELLLVEEGGTDVEELLLVEEGDDVEELVGETVEELVESTVKETVEELVEETKEDVDVSALIELNEFEVGREEEEEGEE